MPELVLCRRRSGRSRHCEYAWSIDGSLPGRRNLSIALAVRVVVVPSGEHCRRNQGSPGLLPAQSWSEYCGNSNTALAMTAAKSRAKQGHGALPCRRYWVAAGQRGIRKAVVERREQFRFFVLRLEQQARTAPARQCQRHHAGDHHRNRHGNGELLIQLARQPEERHRHRIPRTIPARWPPPHRPLRAWFRWRPLRAATCRVPPSGARRFPAPRSRHRRRYRLPAPSHNSVSVFIEKPNAHSPAKVLISDTGTAIIGIMSRASSAGTDTPPAPPARRLLNRVLTHFNGSRP